MLIKNLNILNKNEINNNYFCDSQLSSLFERLKNKRRKRSTNTSNKKYNVFK